MNDPLIFLFCFGLVLFFPNKSQISRDRGKKTKQVYRSSGILPSETDSETEVPKRNQLGVKESKEKGERYYSNKVI